ncbi:hypothetical protein EV128_10714 [Rhizobium azibense]|nr:hypothetical protein EV128_10714 [Rhizobium azibense]
MFIDSKEMSVDRRHFVYGGAAAFSAMAAALAGGARAFPLLFESVGIPAVSVL